MAFTTATETFVPDTQGKWKYSTASNVRTLDGQTGSFSVSKPSRQNHGPIRVANSYHLAYTDGPPYEKKTDAGIFFW